MGRGAGRQGARGVCRWTGLGEGGGHADRQGFVPAGSVSISSAPQIFREASHF